MSKSVKVLVLVAFEICSVAALHGARNWSWLRLPDSHPAGWLASNPPLDTIATLIRPIALVAAVWVLLSTLSYAVALRSGSRVAPRIASMTLPMVRRVIEGTIAVGVSTIIATGPTAALAMEVPPPHLDATAREPSGGGPAAAVVFERLGRAGPAGNDTTQEARDGAERTTYVVRRGDNLWKIAARRVREVTAFPENAAIAHYWRRLIAANRDHLRSGDPDLIYPGETIVLPDPIRE